MMWAFLQGAGQAQTSKPHEHSRGGSLPCDASGGIRKISVGCDEESLATSFANAEICM
jgi:hypothetical protein